MYVFNRNKKKLVYILLIFFMSLTLSSCLVPHLVLSEIIRNNGMIKIHLNRGFGSEVYTFDGNKDDVFRVYSEVRSGNLKIEITDPDNKVIYQGNGQDVTKFTFRLSITGRYTIVVKSRWCDGFVYINKIEGEKK